MSPAPDAAIWEPTPGQTVGPFFALGLDFDRMAEVAHPFSPDAITLSGTITDGDGVPVPDAVIEIFGANTDGTVPRARGSFRRDGRTFTGFGRAATDDEGRYQLWTRQPASVAGRAPFFAVTLFARGVTDALRTRIYIPDDALLGSDAFLSRLDPDQRDTLVATRLSDGHLVHDIRLQGENETVFLAHSSQRG